MIFWNIFFFEYTRYSCKRNVSLHQGSSTLLPEVFASNRCDQSTGSCTNIWYPQLGYRNGWIGIAISIIDQSVERLVDKLPENNGWNGSEHFWTKLTFLFQFWSLLFEPVKLQHGSCNNHSARHLKAHTTKHVLQLAGVWVKCRRVEFLGVDYLVSRYIGWFFSQPILLETN